MNNINTGYGIYTFNYYDVQGTKWKSQQKFVNNSNFKDERGCQRQ